MADETTMSDDGDAQAAESAAEKAEETVSAAPSTLAAPTRQARLLRLARSVPIVLRRHGPLTLGWNALRWLGGQRGYFLRDLLMDVPNFRALPDTAPDATPVLQALCISGVGQDPMRYRCAHLIEQFALHGYRADVVTIEEAQLAEALTRYRVFVLHRVMAAPDTLAFVAEAQRRGKIVIFDTDDLVFDAALLDQLPGTGELTPVERQYIADTVERNGRMLRACDAVTVSTAYLRDFILKTGLHQRVSFIPNVMSAAMLQSADAALASRITPAPTVAPRPGETVSADRPARAPVQAQAQAQATVTIGYFSGTRTHSRDFLEAADALLWALERYPQALLLIVGPLALDSRFDPYAGRITHLRRQPWQTLPSLYTTVDINLAPLERSNPFTEAKSCIKYLEAALCRVPTIASPRSDYRRVIAPGVTGMLADTPAEWRAALAHLIESPEERRAMGESAWSAVRERETTAARAEATCAVYRSLAPAAFARSASTGSTPTGSTPTGSTPTGSTPTGSTPTGSTSISDIARGDASISDPGDVTPAQ